MTFNLLFAWKHSSWSHRSSQRVLKIPSNAIIKLDNPSNMKRKKQTLLRSDDAHMQNNYPVLLKFVQRLGLIPHVAREI